MTKKKIRIFPVFAALVLMCFTSAVQAAPGDPDDDPDPKPGTQIPFDGGISLLVAAGIAYAAKKGHDKRNKEKQKSEIEK